MAFVVPFKDTNYDVQTTMVSQNQSVAGSICISTKTTSSLSGFFFSMGDTPYRVNVRVIGRSKRIPSAGSRCNCNYIWCRQC